MAAVLVADDAAIVRTLVREMLHAGGHDVVGEATSGEETIRLFDETDPDVAVIDINMPETNGLGAAREIRRRHPGARLILASVFVAGMQLPDAGELGAEYLAKPFRQDQLLAAIARAVQA
jgi:two-component system chemotaxis response regulator CheY